MSSTVPDFSTPRLAEAVEGLSQEQVNALPFGAIRLDKNGRVAFFSDAERRLSGFNMEAIGRTFFTEMAPCMDNPAFRGRIERALARGSLDIEFDHIGDFSDREREIRVRVQSAQAGGCWIFMQRVNEMEAGRAAKARQPGAEGACAGD